VPSPISNMPHLAIVVMQSKMKTVTGYNKYRLHTLQPTSYTMQTYNQI